MGDLFMETKRLLLRKFNANDWSDLYEYLSNDEVVKFEPYDVFTVDACKQEAVRRSNEEAFWAVCLIETGKMIGNIYLSKQDFDTWELGYVFNSSFHGKGFATEAAKALVDYVFNKKNARRVIGMCSPLNISSWKLLERLGLRREGHLIQNIYFKKDAKGNPIWLDTYEYGILATEWSNLH